ncbi:MAG: sigma-70 family RNA polymerase sigma factor [Halanaerobiales bacterium]|nr:sigma-70 family RNA polymerase sigma factor [Halanaerobiales bacterium]
MNELDTSNLNIKEVTRLLQEIKRYIDEIKNGEHEGQIVELVYPRRKQNKTIDMKNFIRKSMKDALKEIDRDYTIIKKKNPYILEELKQQVIMVLLRRIRNNCKLEPGAPRKVLNSFFSYINGTVISAVRHYMRNIAKQKLHFDDEYRMVDKYNDKVASINLLGDNAKSPEEMYIEKENTETINKYINTLTSKQREVLELNKFWEKTQEEIASQMGISQQAVSKLLLKATENLRLELLDNEVAMKYKNYYVA